MSDAGWIHPGPISPLDCDQADCGWRVHGVPDKYHADALARHTAEAHQPAGAVTARDEAVEMIRRICPAHLDADWYGQFLAEKFDTHRAEVLREAAEEFASRVPPVTAGPLTDRDRGLRYAAADLRRLADEAVR